MIGCGGAKHADDDGAPHGGSDAGRPPRGNPDGGGGDSDAATVDGGDAGPGHGDPDAGGGGHAGVEIPRMQAMIGAQGGAVTSEDHDLLLVVPEGAVAEDVMFTIAPMTVDVEGTIGTAYVLGPEGLTFDQPVALTFGYDSAAGISPAAIKIGTLVDDAWAPLSMPLVDEARGRLSALTTHFSVFGRYTERCDVNDRCFERHQACVTGLAPNPVCAIPCRSQGDCPDPLYCQAGGCMLKGCYSDPDGCTQPGHVCAEYWGYNDLPASEHNRICLPGCNTVVDDNVCPSNDYMYCGLSNCRAFHGCQTDSGCNADETCYGGHILDSPVGECIACNLGCDCRDAGCPCVSTDQARCDKCESDSDCTGGEVCNDDGTCVECNDHDDCASGESCNDAHQCTPCSSECIPGSECTSFGQCCPGGGAPCCDNDTCTCTEIGNGCGEWNFCDPAGGDSCGDGVDNDCDGTPEDGCVACGNDAGCNTLQQCSGGYCSDCSSNCTPGATCSGTQCINVCDSNGCICEGFGNDCSRWQACDLSETCDNGLDDDCNGTVDDGCDTCAHDSDCDPHEYCWGGSECRPCTATCTPGTTCMVGQSVSQCEGYGRDGLCAQCLLN
jgi:hypothetical protein